MAGPRSFAAPGADGALHDLGLEQERPGRDDPLARLEAPGDLDDVAPVGRPGQDPLRAVAPSLLGEEDEVGLVLPLDGRLGDDDGLVLGAEPDLGAAELVGPEAAVGVRRPRPGRAWSGSAR